MIVHAFEEAGLGKAPFRFVGLESSRDRAAVQRERESNGLTFTTNYCTSCDYCAQAIQNAYYVESSDGKRFKVGCNCIAKTGDSGLVDTVKRAKREADRVAKLEANRIRTNSLLEAFRAGRCEALRAQPHPAGREGTAWDYVNWCITNNRYGSGILKLIEKSMDAI